MLGKKISFSKKDFEDSIQLSEKESLRLGFRRCELMATVSGILLYEKRGYEVVEETEYVSRKGNIVPMYKMEKEL